MPSSVPLGTARNCLDVGCHGEPSMGVADKVQCAYGGLDGLALLRAC